MTIIKYLPSFLTSFLHRIAIFVVYDLSLNLPIMKLKKYHYGFGILSNSMTFNSFDTYAPLVPNMKTIFVAVMNTP